MRICSDILARRVWYCESVGQVSSAPGAKGELSPLTLPATSPAEAWHRSVYADVSAPSYDELKKCSMFCVPIVSLPGTGSETATGYVGEPIKAMSEPERG